MKNDFNLYLTMNISKLKVGVTSTAVILGCAGVTYLILKYKRKLRDAAAAFNYLNIKIVTNAAECEIAVLELRKRCQYHHAVGFDCEWVTDNGKRKPVSLLQLSTYDGYCCLFRLNEMGGTMPLPLKELLEDETIYKVGVAPADDARYLHLDYKIFLKASLDVRHIANLCGYDAGGLGALSQSLLGVMLDKSWRIRCSDWEAEELAERQIKYAAADAHVAIRIFAKLIDDLSVKNIWSLFKRRNGNIWNNLDRLCWQFSDIHYKARNAMPVDNIVTKEKASVKKEGMTMTKRYPHATRSKPLYHNCFLEAPDGELLCTCDNKKAMWYVDKDLADVIKGDPLTVRLRFEPSGRSVGDVGRYYQLTKENKCVVCGATNSYIRKNVVPREYRKYLPEIMKDHSSHDVVLLCVRCHQRSNAGDLRVRARLAALCAAPLAARDRSQYTEDVTCKKIRSAARALLYQSRKHVLPEARQKELESILLEHYPLQEVVTEKLLKEAAEMQVVSFENADYECHGQKVVEYFTEQEGGLLRLEETWREHFLSSMRPKYMPALWSVKHNEERLRVRLKEGRLSEEELKLLGVSRWL